MGGVCSTYRERLDAYGILVGKPEGKRSFGRPRRRWDDNILIFIKWDREAWTGLIGLRIGMGGGLL